ncbi:hypothetical protein ABIC65_001044 [Sphingomonas trueperi]|uniref:hypothetical protein n=1 Tax=Sphingomonas trueperi TaxID=53317 RepID=UPI0033997404
MSEKVKLSIVQIVVKVDDGDYCGVLLPRTGLDMLVGMLPAFADGPIKLVRLPGLKMVPLSELTPND